MTMMRRLAMCLLLLLPLAAAAQEAQTVLHLLDYVAVDYPEAVADGKVKSEDEYKEMLEFTAKVGALLNTLPENPGRAALLGEAAVLENLVKGKADAPKVAEASRKLRNAVVATYKLRIAPRVAPDLARAKALYTQNCASCHGASGRGDGPAAKGLDPAPADFHDLERMAQRSAYGLYNTVTLGVEGTSMTAFKQLSDDERWALAFYAANLGVPAERVQEGEKLWKAGKAKNVFADLGPVATLSTEEVVEKHGQTGARVQDYLRAHPEVLKPAPIAFTRQKLAEALDAYKRGDRAAARQAAITGYLEGFELVEASLENVDAGLKDETERRMMEVRAAIESGVAPAELDKQIDAVDALLAAAQDKLGAGELSPGTAFLSALIILLREGLEAILVLAAIIAFVARTERRDAMPWVHAGWLAALVLGGVTWVVAAYLVDISGAGRELTEGVIALIASAMLLYVGYWLHSKSYADAWTRFIRQQVGQALAKRTVWAMAALSFLAVYREMFEIVLFYEALWLQAGDGARPALLGGIAVAAAALAAIGFAIFKYSLRLPLKPFFAVTSALLVALAIAFAGNGVAALQEAGVVGAHGLPGPSVPILGIHPSLETLGAQLFTLLLVILGYWVVRRSSRSAQSSSSALS